MIPDELEPVLDCLEGRIELVAVVLFGSRARGDALDTSDWDLAVISPDFEPLDPLRRSLQIVDCASPGIEFACLTPGELLRPEYSYLRCAILEEGEPLIDRGAFAAAREGYRAAKRDGRIIFRDDMVEFRETAG